MLRYILNLFHATVFLLWTPAAVFAAGLAITGGSDSPFAVPTALVIGSLIFSTAAGATTLATSIARQLQAHPGQSLVAPWWNAGAHMGGSWLAGTLGFLTCMATGQGVWTLLITVLVMSFVGAKALEIAAQKVLPGYTPKEQ